MTTLAIDIGGTKIAAAVCDENDSIIQRWRVPTPMDADAINQHIAEVYREAVAAGHTDIEAIGISAAGNVSADRKTLTFSANIPAWINYDLSEHVGALIDHAVPVVVENDANCAGWGEYVHGAGQGSSNMVALTVATSPSWKARWCPKRLRKVTYLACMRSARSANGWAAPWPPFPPCLTRTCS